jgi:DNA invertase Pin-like site-specific DNA recombinase
MPLKRVALYVRVSTSEQDTGRQEDDLRIEVLRAGNESVFVVYRDTMSGGVIRPGFQEMMTAARQHKFDKLRVWSLDRFSREGVLKTLTHLKRLADLGIEFSSLAEPILDTSDEMTRDIVLSVIAAIAESYRKRVRENTMSGLKRAKASGKTLGRKKGSKDSEPRRKSGYYLRWQKEPKKRVKKGTVKKEKKKLDHEADQETIKAV